MISISKSNIIYLSAGIVLGFSIFLAINSFNPPDNSNDTVTESRNQQNYHFINPLLECDSGSALSTNKNLNGLKKQLTDIINQETDKKNITFGAVYYRDLNNGPWIGVNENELFSPASLIKVPLMIAYYKLSESDPSILQKTLTNTDTYNPNEQNFAPDEHLETNQTYTVTELIRRMITYSDNMAYKLLLDNIDSKLVYKIYSDLGVDISQAAEDPSGNIVSVKNYAAFYRVLFNSSYLDKDNSEKALELLSHSTFNQGITASLPKNITVSHKFGERQYLETGEKQLHDCGIVYDAKKPYLLCIMTRSNNFSDAAKTVAKISKTTFDAINNSN